MLHGAGTFNARQILRASMFETSGWRGIASMCPVLGSHANGIRRHASEAVLAPVLEYEADRRKLHAREIVQGRHAASHRGPGFGRMKEGVGLPSRDPAGRPLVAQEGPRNGRASRVPGIPHGSAGLIQPLIDEKRRQTENHLPESEAATLDRAPASATKVVSERFVAVGRAEPPDCIEAPTLHQASRHKIRVACRVHATWVAVPKELREGDRGCRVFQPAFFHGDISVCACWPAGRDRMPRPPSRHRYHTQLPHGFARREAAHRRIRIW